MQLQQLQFPEAAPNWNEGAEQRLLASMLLAAVIVAGVLSLVRMPDLAAFPPVVEILVNILQDPVPEIEEETVQQPTQDAQTQDSPLPEEAAAPPTSTGGDTLEESRTGTDWEAMHDQVVQKYMDLELEEARESYGYFNPDLADTRTRLSERYQPGTHEKPKPIWENVEVDTLGRTVLRDGDCYKVLDDPNVGSREAFERYGQFNVVCVYQGRYPRELPWVEEIRQRYEYLRKPEGYVKGEPGT